MRITWRMRSESSRESCDAALVTVAKRCGLAQEPTRVTPASRYYFSTPSNDEAVQRHLAALREHPEVIEDIMVEVSVDAPFVAATAKALKLLFPQVVLDDEKAMSADLRKYQGYLEAASRGGIGARYAWKLPGGDGRGITVVDLEWGGHDGHEDLPAELFPKPPGQAEHAVQTLGLIGALRNEFGIDGIASGADVTMEVVRASSGGTTGDFLKIEAVLEGLGKSLDAGDVVLLELQAKFQPPDIAIATSNLPVEYSPSIREAIDAISDLGIYVVEAAGNGGENLADFGLDQAHRSAAIMVGAGDYKRRSKVPASNYGTRVDLQAWGNYVVTTGEGSLQSHKDPRRRYSQTFNHTSSASAIVAGAVACLSGIVSAHGIDPLTPTAMRDLLVRTGTPQPAKDRKKNPIGPLPNVRKALERLKQMYPKQLP